MAHLLVGIHACRTTITDIALPCSIKRNAFTFFFITTRQSMLLLSVREALASGATMRGCSQGQPPSPLLPRQAQGAMAAEELVDQHSSKCSSDLCCSIPHVWAEAAGIQGEMEHMCVALGDVTIVCSCLRSKHSYLQLCLW